MSAILSGNSLSMALCERSLTLQVAIQAPNVINQIVEHGEKAVIDAISILLLATSKYFNTGGNLTPEQSYQIASLFMSEYKQESIEDLALCLKKLKLGSYGKIYRIDGEVLFKCFNDYLDEKYSEFEKIKQNEKQEADIEASALYVWFAAEILKRKEEKQKEVDQKPMPLFLTDKGHFEAFKQMLPDFSGEKLTSILKYYKSINTPVGAEIIENQPITVGHFDHYIEAINTEIKARQ